MVYCLRNKCHAISTVCLQLRESVGYRYVLFSYLEEALTHTVTHTTKGLESRKECRTEFCIPCGVGVGAEGEARIVVPEHTADYFYVHAILERQRCEGVARLQPR